MEITICEINKGNQLDFGRCDSSLAVNSKLVLNAEDGRIRYTVVDVSPYIKEYRRYRTDFAEYENDPTKIIFLAYLNDEIAGQVKIMEHWNRYALIDDFAVDIKYRRQGVGRALIQHCIEWAKKRKFPGISLETQNINVPACQLYASCGFELRGFDTHLYKAIDPSTDEIALYWYLMF
ncbi:MAG TPA: GNAT family N-acetyltransferase [Anaerolineales bacterium]|nr:GNAT family N-acetyltransferase [Anaerolineales bacterium]